MISNNIIITANCNNNDSRLYVHKNLTFFLRYGPFLPARVHLRKAPQGTSFQILNYI